jgi:putative glutamine amidotransferase
MTAARPVLGVICCQRRLGSDPVQAVANRYVVAAMTYADAAALLIPALPALLSVHEIAPRLDGVLLTGSPSNIEPRRYSQGDASPAGPFDPDRDAMTLGLIQAMLDLGKPVFGICRGLQELNVAFGGDLRRDVTTAPDLLRHHAPDDVAVDEMFVHEGGAFEAMFAHEHEVALTPRGLLSQAFGQDRIRVNSVHYQGIGRLGQGLTVEATAPDGLVEAVSAEVNGAPVVGVQWHPEWRTAENSNSQAFFRMLGRALRGQPVATELRT